MRPNENANGDEVVQEYAIFPCFLYIGTLVQYKLTVPTTPVHTLSCSIPISNHGSWHKNVVNSYIPPQAPYDF